MYENITEGWVLDALGTKSWGSREPQTSGKDRIYQVPGMYYGLQQHYPAYNNITPPAWGLGGSGLRPRVT